MTTRAKAVETTSPATPPDDRQPYTLESGNLISEIDRQRLAALSELEALDAAVLDIETRANQDIATIRARADVEISARRSRADDLNKLVDIANRALNLPPPAVEVAYRSGPDEWITVAGLTLADGLAALEQSVKTLESLRPHWAQGYTSDSMAAQASMAALSQLWDMLGATNQTEAVQRVTILQGVAKGEVWVTPRHNRHYALTSISGAHIGMWSKREDAVAAAREYEGSSLTELVETGPLSADNPVDRIWLKVGECLAGMGHADVSPAARRKIEAAIKDAING